MRGEKERLERGDPMKNRIVLNRNI
jgi:hypothetical protein